MYTSPVPLIAVSIIYPQQINRGVGSDLLFDTLSGRSWCSCRLKFPQLRRIFYNLLKRGIGIVEGHRGIYVQVFDPLLEFPSFDTLPTSGMRFSAALDPVTRGALSNLGTLSSKKFLVPAS